ncbi:MAG TPA: RNA methyltransferase [Oligoflexus sp.]|uniref:RNA methyltransferase n=1 Tax=Oligoflexus sp. TaxID=1971216 RepID=UPI002D80D527|nr:RNA methyltransferase [Oligoflexus sp.]HET9241163.1 RNA methyltransferase [Oligoflexus sp.]
MELRRFLELNEAMALRELLDQILRVEAAWDDESQRQAQLQKLFELLDGAALHRGPIVRGLASLRQRIPDNPTFHQFMSLVVPIERQHSRAIADGDFPVASEDRQEPKEAQLMPLVLVLDNLRSAFNLGSIWRLAECLGVSKLHLTGYTATPDQAKVSRAALGTEQLVAWEWHAHREDCLEKLRVEGYALYALETSPNAVRLDSFAFPKQKVALLLGNERYGFESDLLKRCDAVLEIPCWGRKNSLNVAVTAGIAVHELRRQWLASGYLST